MAQAEYELSRTYFGGEAFPFFFPFVGAGDLAAFLGSPVEFTTGTVWYHTCMAEPPENHPPLRCDQRSELFQAQLALNTAAMKSSRGRYFVALPDLIENFDILASLRGIETLLMDLVDRPDWVSTRIEQINQAYFEAFDVFYQKVRDADGGNTSCFNLWAPGKLAKVQCDAAAMLSPAAFRQFVAPALQRQCQWLDYAMYHLDGENAMCHLDALLEIPEIQAIEWTPQFWSQGQGGGKPMWYDLYRRILAGGKSVQAVFVEYDEVIPLLDAVGPKGMYIWTSAANEEQARKLEEKVDRYR